MRVKHTRSDSGNCREYYRGEDGRLYCTQPAEGVTMPAWRANPGLVAWYECSKDGEPSHRVNGLKIVYTWTMPEGYNK